MSAVRRPEDDGAPFVDVHPIRALGLESLDEVMAIEVAAYAYPWSRGNFVDSLVAGYSLRGRHAPDGTLLGYYVAMPGFEEIHLLNITVLPSHEGRGHARALLADLYRLAAARGARAIWLEVRESNARARELYRREGFAEAGRRRQYYPAPGGREDAILMTLPTPGLDAPGTEPLRDAEGCDDVD
jgi:ribosomal-protein-alanine N-acetyltransferase